MSRIGAGISVALGFAVGGALGAVGGAFIGPGAIDPALVTRREEEEIATGAAIGALLGSVIAAAISAGPSTSTTNQVGTSGPPQIGTSSVSREWGLP